MTSIESPAEIEAKVDRKLLGEADGFRERVRAWARGILGLQDDAAPVTDDEHTMGLLARVEAVITVGLATATRFEWPGQAVCWFRRQTKDWIVTDWDGCRTSRHDSLEGALAEGERLRAEVRT